MSGLAHFRVRLRPLLRDSEIEVNGQRVDEVRALRIDQVDNEFPTLSIVLNSDAGELEGDGIVKVTEGRTVPETVEMFLTGIDPQQLEADALNDSSLGGATTGELFLATLLRYARGG